MCMTNALGRKEKWTPWENNNNFHPQHLLKYHNCEVFYFILLGALLEKSDFRDSALLLLL